MTAFTPIPAEPFGAEPAETYGPALTSDDDVIAAAVAALAYAETQDAPAERVNYHTLLEQAASLPADAPAAAIDDVFYTAASMALSPVQREAIVQAMKGKAGLGLTTLREGMNFARGARANDVRDNSDDYRDRLVTSTTGDVYGNEANVLIVLSEDEAVKNLVSYDEFTQKITLLRRPPYEPLSHEPWKPRLLGNEDYTLFTGWLQTRNIPARENIVASCLHVAAKRNTTNVLKSYLTGLRWDNKSRINTWLTKYVGVDQSHYTMAVGRFWLLSAVARVMRPGVKVDTMLIFEGEQGKKKSQVWRTLAGNEYFMEFSGDITNKDTLILMEGMWIFEFSELASLAPREIDAVKSFLSRQTDDYRSPYAKLAVRHPRQCVFGGSTNNDTYLKDETGARRFWPVATGVIDIDALAVDRDQLWAEAMVLFNAGEKWWVDTEDTWFTVPAKEEAEKRYERGSWDDIVETYVTHEGHSHDGKFTPRQKLSEPRRYVKIATILTEALNTPIEKHNDKRVLNALGKILKKLGYRGQTYRPLLSEGGGATFYAWVFRGKS